MTDTNVKLQKRDLAKAIQTANDWSSDQKGKGLALLQLGTTRRVHSEDHRIACLLEIKDNLAFCEKADCGEDFDPAVEKRRLNTLRVLVTQAQIGHEWLADRENLRLNEELHQTGELRS